MSITVEDLTASRPVCTDANKTLVSSVDPVWETITRINCPASTTTTIWTEGLTDDYSYFIEAIVLQRNTAGTDTNGYKMYCTAYRDSGGNVVIVGQDAEAINHEDVANTPAFVVSGTDLLIQITQAGTAQYAEGIVRMFSIAKA